MIRFIAASVWQAVRTTRAEREQTTAKRDWTYGRAWLFRAMKYG